MPPTVTVSSTTGLRRKAGGHAWLYLNWILGLRALDFDIVWLESFDPTSSEDELDVYLGMARQLHSDLGLQCSIALCASEGEPLPWDSSGKYLTLEDAAAKSDLYLDLAYMSHRGVVSRFQRTAFVDQDPGLMQLWLSTGHLEIADYDTYFTIGETVGRARAQFPDCGVPWTYTRPPIYLEAWPQSDSDESASYTTVTNWWGEWILIDGELVDNSKRSAFLEFVELALLSSVSFELAITLTDYPDDFKECNSLREKGWLVRKLNEKSWMTPQEHRRYVQNSRGEFSCAKAGYRRLSTGMVFDRTLQYLASGKPAVVQYTGPSNYLPDNQGLFRFRDIAEALHAFRTIEEDYAQQSRFARELAEQHFDSKQILPRLLEHALL